jgi:hypothetical protein
MTGVNEIGRKSVSIEDGGFFLGRAVTSALFHSVGTYL